MYNLGIFSINCYFWQDLDDMDDFKEILVPIIIMIGVLASSFLKKKKEPEKNTSRRQNDEQDEWLAELGYIKKSPPDTKKTPISVPVVPYTKIPPRPFINEEPSQEGRRTINIENTEKDVYQENTQNNLYEIEDWRRAIIAHEILKRKF